MLIDITWVSHTYLSRKIELVSSDLGRDDGANITLVQYDDRPLKEDETITVQV